MENFKTSIFWNLHDYCRAECSYCPVQYSGGGLHPETKDYIQVINTIVNAYTAAGRTIDWFIDGGEPLDMDDIVTILKLCRTNGTSLMLSTNGGKLWVDWWAIEPYVDSLKLTYHYWQNPALMKYIIDTFREKGKPIEVLVPIRPGEHFRSDITRATALESECNFYVSKTLLYKEADQTAGLFPYTHEDLNKIYFWNLPFKDRIRQPQANPADINTFSPEAKAKVKFDSSTWDTRYQEKHQTSPKFTGQLCNAGVERLHIGHLGWVSGSCCGNQSMGNIWQSGWYPSISPQKCSMLSCAVEFDRTITKFPVTVE